MPISIRLEPSPVLCPSELSFALLNRADGLETISDSRPNEEDLLGVVGVADAGRGPKVAKREFWSTAAGLITIGARLVGVAARGIIMLPPDFLTTPVGVWGAIWFGCACTIA